MAGLRCYVACKLPAGPRELQFGHLRRIKAEGILALVAQRIQQFSWAEVEKALPA